jgi:hypothetical protein
MSKGMLVSCYVNAELGNCCGPYGLSNRFKKFVLTGCGMPEIFSPSADAPEIKLVEWYGFYKAVPVAKPDGNLTGPMFGGAFVYTCDSRFSAITKGHPVPLHDRFED